MKDIKEDDQLELGFERGKRVEFTYDEPAQQDMQTPEQQEEHASGQQPHRNKKTAAILAVFLCVLLAGVLIWFCAKTAGRQNAAEGTDGAEQTQDADGMQPALTLSEDYEVHLEQLKSYLSQKYSGVCMMELNESGEYPAGRNMIMIADLDGDGARPEAIVLPTDEASQLTVIYFDISDRLQMRSVDVGHACAQSLMLDLKKNNTAQLILYQQDSYGLEGCSQLFEYNAQGISVLSRIGEVAGKIAAHNMVNGDGGEYVSYELNGVYQVRESVSCNNDYEDYTYERVYFYVIKEDSNTLVPAEPDGAALYGKNVYYELEHMPWWNMRRPLLAVSFDSNMDEQYMNIRERDVLYGTAVHLIGGFSGTDMYLAETDYGDRGIILLSAPDDPDSCMVVMQGLPFFEVFASEKPQEVFNDLYAYLDVHITAPGYYKLDQPSYIWIDLNGDGAERRFYADEHGIGNYMIGAALLPFEVDGSGDMLQYLTVTDLDPDDHKMEIGSSVFLTGEGEDASSAQAFTYLYQSLDGIHLEEISGVEWSSLYNNVLLPYYRFTPFDPVSGEANYEDGRIWLEYAGVPAYGVWAVYNGQMLHIEDESFAVLNEPLHAVTAVPGLLVYKESAPDEEIWLAEGTTVALDGFMMKMDTDADVFAGMDTFLYSLHLSIDQETYYTGYMTRSTVIYMLGLSEFNGLLYQE